MSITVLAGLFTGWLSDRIGPHLAYTGLLLLGSLPVVGIAFANSFESFVAFRGAIGAAFDPQSHQPAHKASAVRLEKSGAVSKWLLSQRERNRSLNFHEMRVLASDQDRQRAQ